MSRTSVVLVVAGGLVAAVLVVVGEIALPGGPEFADLTSAFRIGGK